MDIYIQWNTLLNNSVIKNRDCLNQWNMHQFQMFLNTLIDFKIINDLPVWIIETKFYIFKESKKCIQWHIVAVLCC